MYNNGNSSKNVTGASVVDGTLENADYADNGLSGDKIDGGTISNFQSTGIDDRLSTGKNITLSDSSVTVDANLHCKNSANTTLTLENTDTSVGTDQILGTIEFKQNDSSSAGVGVVGRIKSINESSWSGLAGLSFETGDASSLTERMRIGSNGNVDFKTFSTTGASYGLRIDQAINPNSIALDYSTDSLGGQHFARFYTSNGLVGNIAVNASSTSYNTTSDYRLKELDVPMVGSIDRLKLLRPINFTWKKAGTSTDGFFAHEAQAVVPECVTGTKDAMMDEEYEVTPAVVDADGNVTTEAVMGTRSVPDYQGIDQSKLVPLLVSALQEAIARIETLEKA
jgi:hypothetical protein